ncbi:MAG: SDR family oxidoreductase [Pseudomonadota bacterium]
MSNQGHDRVAAITGAASGLGRALAVEFARRGWRVALSDVNDEGGEQTLSIVRSVGGKGSYHHLDVTDAEAVEAFAEAVWAEWGRCDALINNAGVAAAGRIGEATLEDWRWCVDIDLFGPVYGCHVFVPRMRKQGSGHVVNIASIAAYAQAPHMGPYNVAKAGVVALSETLRGELLNTNIGVTVVCPAFFRTNIATTMRFTDPKELKTTERLVGGAQLDADEVAIAIIKAIEHNQPFVIMPAQARFLFWARRLLPARATELLRAIARLT